MVNKRLRFLRKVNVLIQNFWKKNSPFMIYADFEHILVPEDSRKQDPNDSCTNKYQNYIACS